MSVVTARAQGIKLLPLDGRPEQTVPVSSNLHGIITDTLTLPFFENFITTSGYPSSKRWTDNQVWINNSFPVDQPDYNVATFDHLNSRGVPYGNLLNKNIFVYADSLTSQPINLQFYKTGPTTTRNYALSDSIYLSFYYLTRGLGDIPEPEDSLILYFKNISGQWKKVWSVTGRSMAGFSQAMVPVLSTEFFSPVFQFRFVNFTKATGNLNHWHLDYIRMDKGRSLKDTAARDIAIRLASPGLLKHYRTMPYSHFLTEPSVQVWGDHGITVRNLNPATTVQTRFQLEVRNRYNSVVLLKPFSLSSRNLLPGDSTENFGSLRMDTLSGREPWLDLTYKISPQSDDITPDNYNAEGSNNELTYRQSFTPWYAWDDGTAEGGFGLNYEFLPDIKGQFAMKFDLVKDDSLHGLAMYFNRSLNDVGFRTFSIRIWKKLSPIGAPDNQDELIYEFPVGRPRYRDSINHFNYIYFDTALFLNKGSYYIGWVQYQNFILNVGYDNNYRFNRQDVKNPNLFFNLLGQWTASDASVKGVPMIRPMVGSRAEYSFSTRKISKSAINVFPNPVSDQLNWSADIRARRASVTDMTGRELLNTPIAVNSLDAAQLPAGTYLLHLLMENGSRQTARFIKN